VTKEDPKGLEKPLLVAGGGLNAGQVIGKSDAQGGRPASDPHTPANLLATVIHFLFDVTQLRLRTDLPRDLKPLIENGEPIHELNQDRTRMTRIRARGSTRITTMIEV
jgi:hypothetical protein